MNEHEFRTGKKLIDVTGHDYSQSRMHERKEKTKEELEQEQVDKLKKQEMLRIADEGAKQAIEAMENAISKK